LEATVTLQRKGKAGGSVYRGLAVEGDLTRARIGQWEVRTVRDATGAVSKVFELPIEVTSKVVERPSFWLRIRMFFKQHVAVPAQSIRRTAEGVLRRLQSRSANAEDIAVDLRNELKRTFPNATRLEVETGDVLVVELTHTNRETKRAE
jgi:hypothetical protein